MKSRAAVLVSVFLLAVTVNFALGVKLGMGKPMVSDAQLYLMIAQSLAEGDGYYLREGFWPNTPTMSRSPTWPFMVSLVLRLCPMVSPDVVMRVLALMLNVLVAVLVVVLTQRVVVGCHVGKLLRGGQEGSLPSTTQQLNNSTTLLLCGFAGLIYIFHPQALYLAYGGGSEIMFLVLALGGTILLVRRAPMAPVMGCQLLVSGKTFINRLLMVCPSSGWSPASLSASNSARDGAIHLLGFLLLGLSCLVRPNYILWIGFMGIIVIGYWLRVMGGGYGASAVGSTNNQQPTTHNCYFQKSVVCRLLSVVCCVILFLAPSFLWALRNYQICGHFPVLSTLRGQTFYGGNNEVVANDLTQWGYWVFPNAIPGETPMIDLSKRMSEYEVDEYYNKKGAEYVQAHLKEMPRLWLGKLIRSYWPVPWKSSLGGFAVGAFRGLLYLMVIAGLIVGWNRLSKPYLVIVAAMLLANIATVLVFWGCSRFAFAVEPFLIPLAAVCAVNTRITAIIQRHFRNVSPVVRVNERCIDLKAGAL